MAAAEARIRTTHVGSLPRPADVTDLVFAAERGEAVDRKTMKTVLRSAVEAVVDRQAEVGLDLVSDGEMSKISYATYIKDRLTNFEGDSPRNPPADLEQYPGFLKKLATTGGTPSYKRPRCVGPIKVKDPRPLEDDLTHFTAALEKHASVEGFMNAASPGVIALFQPSDYHQSHELYLADLAAAMREEYERIVAAGLDLQIDSPDLGLGRHVMFKDLDDDAYLSQAAQHVEALNFALEGVPADRVRLHVCWGNYEGPHTCDIELAKILPILLKAKPRTLLFECANPRHAHEWAAFEDVTLPDDYVLVPGCIDSTTNFVEHPELVAQRILRFTAIVGPERVIAGTDCGFSTFAGFGTIDPDIVYAKLESLVEGARLASARL